MPEHEKQDRAERLFKAREQQKADAPQAMAEYHAAIERVRERTDELRRQRLARETRKHSKKASKQARSARPADVQPLLRHGRACPGHPRFSH
jgi:hypothetical protein